MLRLIDYLEKAIADLERAIKRRNLKKTEFAFEKLVDFSNYLKELLPEAFIQENLGDFERHMHFIKHFLKKKNFEWIQSNFDDIKERDFPGIKLKIYSLIETEKSPKKKLVSLSKNVFIVHGRDRKPVSELKSMLKEFGLNPIVLHEQPSGSRTIVEKLEKYSDVGYAFVILTPDDAGCDYSQIAAKRKKENLRIALEMSEPAFPGSFRARQNVILEFGYFMGLLGRDRVCCLYKGGVELPSDMQGIVYIQFEESVNETIDMIVKELKAAGYDIDLTGE